MTIRGVRIGIDVGKVRIGVAKSDPMGLLATPLQTIKRSTTNESHITEIIKIANEYNAQVIYVGDPINLKGVKTLSTEDARNLAKHLNKHFANVRLIDERLSTVTAQSNLGATGRTTKTSKNVIDQAAAAVLLQNALEFEIAQKKLAGRDIKYLENIDGDADES